MTLPIVGSTPGAQSSNQSIAATSDANGNITFVGPSGIQGATITCVATVPNAPAAALFVAMLGGQSGLGVALQTWLGGSTAGRFQVGVGQTIVVTGSGLLPSTQYTCTFAAIIDVGDVQVIIPEPNSSITGSAPSVVTFKYFGGNGQTFTVPANVASITYDMAGAQGGGIAPSVGGLGCRIQGTIPVVPGDVLTLNVGKAGAALVAALSAGGTGYMSGGSSSASEVGCSSGGGGGATGITSSRVGVLAVAGGGGGAVNGVIITPTFTANGGSGGISGTAGGNMTAGGPVATGGGGATPTAGGAAGVGTALNGQAGTSTTAGNGTESGGNTLAAGSGGGGFFGGGSGGVNSINNGSGAGGGGSSEVAVAQGVVATFTPGFETGDGYVTITYVVV